MLSSVFFLYILLPVSTKLLSVGLPPVVESSPFEQLQVQFKNCHRNVIKFKNLIEMECYKMKSKTCHGIIILGKVKKFENCQENVILGKIGHFNQCQSFNF